MIDAHRGAFEYDWRTRFHLPLSVIGKSMTWGEAIRLTNQLIGQWGSAVGAAHLGWDYPMTQEAAILADLYDLTLVLGSRKRSRPKPYPRPWPDKERKRFGDARLSIPELRAILDAHRGTPDDAEVKS